MKGICALCKLEKELKQSHIIPEFMYQNVYDQQPRRFYSLNVNLDDTTKSFKQIQQKGIREDLLCGDCELLLSKYERYAAETLYGKNRANKGYIVHQSESPDQSYFLYDYAGLEYKSFKLFQMSLLWRALVSSTYSIQGTSLDIKEKLRLAIFSENPLDFDDFGCIVQIIKYKKGERAGGFILSPFVTNNNGNLMVHILIDGMMFSFYIDSKTIDRSKKEVFLMSDGTMQIIGRVLFKDAGLSEIISKAYKYFETIK